MSDFPANLSAQQLDSRADEKVDVLVILCHGFGAPGSDLIPIAEMVTGYFSQQTELSIRFIVPEAPLRLDDFSGYEARAWWEINMEKLAQAMGGDFERLFSSTPDGLDEARELLLKLIQSESEKVQLPLSRIILAGFSQGAMLSTEVALSLPENVGGLAIFSGTLIRREVWKEGAARHQGLRIIQSHGSTDMILQMFAAKHLKEMLEESGLTVDFIPFDGPHTIPQEAILALVKLIQQVSDAS